ncbi:uncharacterized protein LOC131613407 [Vicia villosa]|uniref:uncharacterized protein LOC131613407 n=1 Tax=Vicia villosa TaxID=3911 RepID=UPI00273C9B79|nr:uncharacterized protein LOC131613407 [Vicia villosa]
MIIGSFNIRGGCSYVKRRRIHQIIINGKANVFLLQETKLKSCSDLIAKSFWREVGIDYSVSDSEGMSGGLIILWNASKLNVVCSFRGAGFLGIKVIWMDRVFYICNVYSPCNLSLKRVLWRNLLDLKDNFNDGEWLLGGDFNSVKNGGERKGRPVVDNQVEWDEFTGFINDIGLEDVSCKGKKFSWFSSDGRSKSQIDRFLVSSNIVNWWGVVGQQIGDRDVSDHCPIWIVVDKMDWGPKPFKFNNEWFQHKDFIGFVEKEWNGLDVHGHGDFVLKEKLRLLKNKLRWWNTTVFGKINLELEEGVKEINAIDNHPSNEEVESGDRWRANRKFWTNLKIRENMLIQKARLKWLNDGDDNSRYFHAIMKRGLRHYYLGHISTARGILGEVEEVKEEIFEHFESKFKESEASRPVLEGDIFNKLSIEDMNSLELPFEEIEIKQAVWSCDGGKSLGPDGYSILFFKKCWEFVKSDVISCFREFHSGTFLSKSITSSFLGLIPKSNNLLGL